MEDCKEAIKLSPKNIKAYYRAAKAANTLGKYDEAIHMCALGLGYDASNPELAAQQSIAREESALLQQKSNAKPQNNSAIREKLATKGIALGDPLFDMAGYPSPCYYFDEQGGYHTSVLFLYEEYSQTDFIQDFGEQDTFADHLNIILPDGTYPAWDGKHTYCADNVEVYFQANDNSRSNKSKLVKVKKTSTLQKVLQYPAYKIPQIPVFYIIASNSEFKEKMLQNFK